MDAMVCLRALTQGTVVAGIFASWACAVEMDLADAADIVFGYVPPPGRDGVPLFDLDLHWGDGVQMRLPISCGPGDVAGTRSGRQKGPHLAPYQALRETADMPAGQSICYISLPLSCTE